MIQERKKDIYSPRGLEQMENPTSESHLIFISAENQASQIFQLSSGPPNRHLISHRGQQTHTSLALYIDHLHQ